MFWPEGWMTICSDYSFGFILSGSWNGPKSTDYSMDSTDGLLKSHISSTEFEILRTNLELKLFKISNNTAPGKSISCVGSRIEWSEKLSSEMFDKFGIKFGRTLYTWINNEVCLTNTPKNIPIYIYIHPTQEIDFAQFLVCYWPGTHRKDIDLCVFRFHRHCHCSLLLHLQGLATSVKVRSLWVKLVLLPISRCKNQEWENKKKHKVYWTDTFKRVPKLHVWLHGRGFSLIWVYVMRRQPDKPRGILDNIMIKFPFCYHI